MRNRNFLEAMLYILGGLLLLVSLALISETTGDSEGQQRAGQVATELDQNMVNEAASSRVDDSRYDLPECEDLDSNGCVWVGDEDGSESFYRDLAGNTTLVSDHAARALIGE